MTISPKLLKVGHKHQVAEEVDRKPQVVEEVDHKPQVAEEVGHIHQAVEPDYIRHHTGEIEVVEKQC